MRFPHANDFEMGDREFIALWARWFDGPGSRGGYWPNLDIPRLAKKYGFQGLVEARSEHGLDAMCRLAIPLKYRNTMQATNEFIDANSHLLTHSDDCINHTSGRKVKSVKLTTRGLELLKEASTDQRLMADIEALIEADTEIVSENDEATLLTNKLSPETIPSLNSATGDLPFSDLQSLVRAFVDNVARDPFQATYRRKPTGDFVLGWSNRLALYFWPNPQVGFNTTMSRMADLFARAQAIAKTQFPWDEFTKRESLIFVDQVFTWGGVPQHSVTAEKVELVARAALLRESNGAPMNSGWTKVAAFLTAHLEDEDQSQAIWDSRVSWSLVRRLDHLLFTAMNQTIPSFLQNIGKVPGRGGTRWTHPLHFPWPNGYGRWDSHYAATSLIKKIRDELNSRQNLAPLPGVGEVAWNVRTVEMVLFMDGY